MSHNKSLHGLFFFSFNFVRQKRTFVSKTTTTKKKEKKKKKKKGLDSFSLLIIMQYKSGHCPNVELNQI